MAKDRRSVLLWIQTGHSGGLIDFTSLGSGQSGFNAMIISDNFKVQSSLNLKNTVMSRVIFQPSMRTVSIFQYF